MPKCRKCGRYERSGYQWQGRLCLNCRAEQEKDGRERLIRHLDTSPVHCYQVESATAYTTPGSSLSMGDLYITSGGIVFIPYTALSLGETHDVGSASFLYGLIGGVAALLGNAVDAREQRTAAESAVDRAREADYGMTVEDRFRLRGGEVIPWSGIKAVEEDHTRDVIRIVHSGGKLELKMALLSKATIDRWLAGNIQDKRDWLGANLGLPATCAFLDYLQGAEPRIEVTSAAQQSIATNPEYTGNLFAVFRHRRWSEQRAAVQGMADMPNAFLEAFGENMRQARNTEKRRFGFVILALGACVGAFLWFLSRTGWGARSTIGEVGCLPSLVGLVAAIGAVMICIPTIGFGDRWCRFGRLLS